MGDLDGRKVLEAAAEAWWQRLLARDPWLPSLVGLPLEHVPELSYGAAEADASLARELLVRLARLDPHELPAEEQTTLDLLRWDLEAEASLLETFWHRFQLTPYASAPTWTAAAMESLRLETAEDRGRYLEVVAQWPRMLDQARETLLGQRQRRVLMPRDEVPVVRETCRSLAGPSDRHPLWPAAERVGTPASSEPSAFLADLARVLETEVEPAATRLLAALDDQYTERAPASIGMGQYAGGAEAYELLVRRFIGRDASPDGLHTLGLQEVARIEERLRAVRGRLGYDVSTPEFREAVRRDPHLQPSADDEFGARMRRHLDAVEARYDEFFAWRPPVRAGIRRLPPEREAGITYGYYQWPTPTDPGAYFIYNGGPKDPLSLLAAAPILFHELIPGHHLQISRQVANAHLPSYRRFCLHEAYAEGWAEYASSLAEEMGAYADPYDLCGRLYDEAAMATRLVLDTGLNVLGWTRERAAAFARDHTLMSDQEIATETLRFASDIPGQALAYHVGHLAIARLRAEAAAGLGARFDLREFHEWVLGDGDLPLPLLERRIRAAVRIGAPAG
jgi:uncharacterized protein (DUF885 family)